MPIPTDGAWPPPAYAPAYRAYRDWDAWYEGSPARLRAVYANRGADGKDLPPSQRTRAGQYAGGLVGTVSRWLWGTPPAAGHRDGRLHVPLPADLTRVAADLIFSEPPKLTSESVAVQERIEQAIEDGLYTVLLHAAEAASALGDVYLRPVLDEDVFPDRAFVATVHADGALPVLRWGKLMEVTFWSTLLVDGDVHVRHLEHHEVVGGVGRIVHAVHEGTHDQLGRAVPLGDYAATAYLSDLVDEEAAQVTGLDRLDVIRVPNSGPQRRWRQTAGLKYLGRSDMDGNEQWFDALDDVWTSWMRDIRLARSRIIVPDYMLQSNGPGMGAAWDAEREVYQGVNSMQREGAGLITAQQFAIRWQEHKSSADAVVETAMRHAGLSQQTLGDEGDVAVTATEVQARERQSFTTRGNRITTAWRPAVAELVELLLAVEAVTFSGRPAPERPNVEFGDSVSEAPETTARTLQLLHAAEAVSTDTKVRMLHPDWDDDQVREEVDRIKDGLGGGMDPAISLGGLAGNTPPGEDPDAEEAPADAPPADEE